MRGSVNDIPVVMEGMGASVKALEWGDMTVSFESMPAGMDPAPYFQGLPDDRCQCPHWGYVIKGRFRVRYKDHEEIVQAGDAYYMAPGHLTVFDEDTQVIEFSPALEHRKTEEVVGRNAAALSGSPS